MVQTPISWKVLEPGLATAEIQLTTKSVMGDSKVHVIRINPDSFQFKLLSAAELKCNSKTMDKWGSEYKLIAAVNASMFKLEGNFNMSTGYMKNFKFINNPTANPNYNNVIAFNPVKPGLPAAQIIDMKCQDWAILKTQYNTCAQNIRMLDCNMKNLWAVSEKKWSMVLMGQDEANNILFIFVRSPYQVHAFVDLLVAQPLKLKRLTYLEGGPEASFYLNHPAQQMQKMGSYETSFNENDKNTVYWDIPNVIGIVRK